MTIQFKCILMNIDLSPKKRTHKKIYPLTIMTPIFALKIKILIKHMTPDISKQRTLKNIQILDFHVKSHLTLQKRVGPFGR